MCLWFLEILESLFKAVKLSKNAYPDRYGYNGYGIGFDARSQHAWVTGEQTLSFLELIIVIFYKLIIKKGCLSSWWMSYTKIKLYYNNSKS